MPDFVDTSARPGQVTMQSQQGADLLLLFLDDLNRSLAQKTPPRKRLEDLLEVMEDTLCRLGEISDGPVNLTLNGWRFCLGWRQVVVAPPMQGPVRRLRETWGRLGIGRMSFPKKVTIPQLRELAVRLKQAFLTPDATRELFWDEASILLEPLPEQEVHWDVGTGAVPGPLLLDALIEQGRQLGQRVVSGQRIRLLPLRRLLICAIERLRAGDESLLQLITSPAAMGAPESHPVHTALLSVQVGIQLGLPLRELLELATAGMLHGMVKVHGIAEEEGQAAPWMESARAADDQRFTFSLVQALARNQGFSAETLPLLMVLYEAQQDFCCDDLYPGFGEADMPISLHGQVIALSAMTSLYIRSAASTDRALLGDVLYLQMKAASKIAPGVAKVFCRALTFSVEEAELDDPMEEHEAGVHLSPPAADHEPAPSPAPEQVARPGRTPRILLVDDEADIRLSLRVMLEEVGFKVSEAEDGMWAAQKLKEGAFDLMILDVMMPHMDGYDLLRSLPSEQLQRLPVIILSARNQDREVDLGLELGAARYMVKPFDIKAVLTAISELIVDLPPEQGRRMQYFLSR